MVGGRPPGKARWGMSVAGEGGESKMGRGDGDFMEN